MDGKVMELTVQGKQMSVGDALREHAAAKLEDINRKYFNHATYATVTFSKEGHGHGLNRAHIHIQIGKEIVVMADAVEGDPYLAFDIAAVKVSKQMHKYKTRLRDHHRRMETAVATQARDYVLDLDGKREKKSPEKESGKHPLIVAEMTTMIQTMSVGEAVMRMDLAGQQAMLFRNASHNGLNMIYRRPDGNIGWIDPQETKAAGKKPASGAKSPAVKAPAAKLPKAKAAKKQPKPQKAKPKSAKRKSA